MNDSAGAVRGSIKASPVAAWFDHHVYSVLASLGRIVRKPFAALLTISVLGLALALPLGLWQILANLERFSGNVQDAREISVFLKQQVDPARARALAQTLRARSDIARVQLRTPEQGLEELRAHSGLAEALAAVGENPLPSVLLVAPRGDEATLADSLRTLTEADLVQHDAQWRDRLDGWLRFGNALAWVLAALLGVGALLVVGNTVRLDIQARREEISILQLLGATDGFIRRPFLYLGAIYGLAAGTLAIVLLTLAASALRLPIAELAAAYGSGFALHGLTPLNAAGVIGAAVLLGWIGAGLVTGHFLRQTRPTNQ